MPSPYKAQPRHSPVSLVIRKQEMNSNQTLYKHPTDIRNHYIEQSLNISLTAPNNINNKAAKEANETSGESLPRLIDRDR